MMDRKSKAEAISPAPDDFQMTNAQASLFFATVAVLALKAPVELCMLAFCCTFWHARVSFDEFEKGDGKMRTDQEEVSIVSLDNISAPTVNCRTQVCTSLLSQQDVDKAWNLIDRDLLRTPSQECSPFFTRFPPEIRNQIYRCLLISKHNGIIERPDILLKFKTKQLVFMARAADRIPFELGIRTAIIHTCCQAYMEALPILYGENIFEFSGAKELDVFKQHGLRTSSKVKSRKQGSELPLFRLNPCLQGRLSHIRKLRLDITENALNESSVQRKRRRYPRPLWGTRPDRTQIASDWELLMSDRTDRILFPSLEQLSLDFVDLGLETEECVAVSLTLLVGTIYCCCRLIIMIEH